MTDERKLGHCPDPLGKCQFVGKTVALYSGHCRPCYDRLRNSNPANKQTMPDLSPARATKEDKDLAKSRAYQMAAFRLAGVSLDDQDTVMKTMRLYYRPIMEQLRREQQSLDTILRDMPGSAVEVTGSTVQQNSTVQQLNGSTKLNGAQHDSTDLWDIFGG
jgi:hypothetical protein